jgi:hypothetical protein
MDRVGILSVRHSKFSETPSPLATSLPSLLILATPHDLLCRRVFFEKVIQYASKQPLRTTAHKGYCSNAKKDSLQYCKYKYIDLFFLIRSSVKWHGV